MQDVFVKAWQKLSTFRFDSSFYTWLRTITTRLVIDSFRRKNAMVWKDTTEIDENHCINTANASDIRDLEKLIGLLPEGARNVFVLHDIEGYKHKEISSMTGIAVGTSKAQLSRARSILRAQLV